MTQAAASCARGRLAHSPQKVTRCTHPVRAGVVEALLAAGADPDAVSPSGKSARELATVRQQEGRGCSEPSRKRLGNLVAGDHQQEGEGDRGDRGARLRLKRSVGRSRCCRISGMSSGDDARGRGEGTGGGGETREHIAQY